MPAKTAMTASPRRWCGAPPDVAGGACRALLSPQVEADQGVLVARKQEPVGQRRIGANRACQNLRARERLEGVGRCRRHDELAALTKNHETIAGERHAFRRRNRSSLQRTLPVRNSTARKLWPNSWRPWNPYRTRCGARSSRSGSSALRPTPTAGVSVEPSSGTPRRRGRTRPTRRSESPTDERRRRIDRCRRSERARDVETARARLPDRDRRAPARVRKMATRRPAIVAPTGDE